MVIDNKFSVVRVVVIVLAVVGLGGLIWWAQTHTQENNTAQPEQTQQPLPDFVVLDGTATDPTQVDSALQQTFTDRENFVAVLDAQFPLAGLKRSIFYTAPSDSINTVSEATPSPTPTSGEEVARPSYEEEFYLIEKPTTIEALLTFTNEYFTGLGYVSAGEGSPTTDNVSATYYNRTTEQGALENLNVFIEIDAGNAFDVRLEYSTTQTYPLSKIPATYVLTEEETDELINQGACITDPNPYGPYWDARYECLYPEF